MKSMEAPGSKPVVSIGLPVFNGEKFVHEALASILAQTFTDFELIISDNASNDSTEAICRSCASSDPRVRYIRQSTNLGAFGNFAAVLKEASGKYFMWASADDFFAKNHVANLVDALEKEPDALVAMSGTTRIRPDGQVHDTVRFSGNRNPERLSTRSMAWKLASGQLYHLYIYGLFRRSFLQNNFKDLPIARGADRMFMCRVAMSGRFSYVDEMSYYRRVFEVPAYSRYKSTDVELARNYRSNLAYLKAIIVFRSYLQRYQWPPDMRRMIIPLIFRYALFSLTAALKGSLKVLYTRVRGVVRRQSSPPT